MTWPMLVVLWTGACSSGDDAPRPARAPSASSSRSAPSAHSAPTRGAPGDATSAIAAISNLKTRLGAGPPPPLGQPGYVEPLTEAQLEWVNDRAVPMNDRIGRAATAV